MNSEALLRMENVVVTGNSSGTAGPFSIEVNRGEAVCLIDDSGEGCSVVGDIASGIALPLSGTVSFEGVEWGMDGRGDFTRRARIGRVFDKYQKSWINNLSVMENITLAQRHHTSRSEADLYDAACALLAEMNVSISDVVRPEALRINDLAAATWARALLGNPSLLIVEYSDSRMVPALIDLISPAVGRMITAGCGVLWITEGKGAFAGPLIAPARTYRYANNVIVREVVL